MAIRAPDGANKYTYFFMIIATLDLSDTNLSDNNNMSDSATEGREEVRFLVKEADM